MLIRFEVTNFRSIAASVELSMVAVDSDRVEAREVSPLGESLLTVAAVFGPNASGKSNVIAAMTWVRQAVRNSLRSWDDEIPVEPFAFGGWPGKPTEFVVEIAVRGVRFEYVLELDSRRVRYEGLFHYPEKKRRRIFERDESGLKLQRGLGSLSGTRELLTERTLALSAARRFDEPLVSGFVDALFRTRTLGLAPSRSRSGPPVGGAPPPVGGGSTMLWFDESVNQPTLFDEGDSSGLFGSGRDQALALLRLADMGIEDVVIDDGEVGYSGSPDVRGRRRVRLLHRTGEHSEPLPFGAESEGTRTWFQLIGPVLTALRDGTLLLFDELDASLHPTLSTELIRLFHDPTTNPRGAQLVFTSHDASLLNHLNRDEIWLTEKGVDGATRLGALAEFAGERVRRSRNLETAYLHGRFGALPQVDQSELLRALGLIA